MGHVVRVVKCTRTGVSLSSGVVASPALLQIYVLPVPLVMIHSKVLVLFLINFVIVYSSEGSEARNSWAGLHDVTST
jgi:hypothetical protein